MTPEDLIDELCHKIVLSPDKPELDAAPGELQSALQEHRDYLESVAADYLLNLPLGIRKWLCKLHETIAAFPSRPSLVKAIVPVGIRPTIDPESLCSCQNVTSGS